MKPENHKLLEIWIKTLNGLLDEDGNGPGTYPELLKDLKRIADDENPYKPNTEAHYAGEHRSQCRPGDGETWEQFCERKQGQGKDGA